MDIINCRPVGWQPSSKLLILTDVVKPGNVVNASQFENSLVVDVKLWTVELFVLPICQNCQIHTHTNLNSLHVHGLTLDTEKAKYAGPAA